MTVLRESPWYEEILKEGEKRGLQQGLQQERVLILKLLARKIGTVPAELQLQIENLTVPELEELGESLLDFTQLEDLVTWLERAR